MSDWTENHLRFQGKTERIQELKTFITDEKGDFDFNKVVPMPEELNIELTPEGEDGYRYLCLRNKQDISDDDKIFMRRVEATPGFDRAIQLGKKYLENRLRYNASDWYDWRWRNWGTKWNACETSWSLLQPLKKEHMVSQELYFETPYTFPLPIVEKLSYLFPDVIIDYSFLTEEYSYFLEQPTYTCMGRFIGGKMVKYQEFGEDEPKYDDNQSAEEIARRNKELLIKMLSQYGYIGE